MSQLVGAYDGQFGRLYAVTTSRRQVAHAHQEWQFIFHLHGPIADFRVEGTPFPVSEGEVLAIPPWTTHAKAYGAQGPCSMLSLLVSRLGTATLRSRVSSGQIGRTLYGAAGSVTECADCSRGFVQLSPLTATVLQRNSKPIWYVCWLQWLLEHSSAPTRRQMAPRARHIDHQIRKALSKS